VDWLKGHTDLEGPEEVKDMVSVKYNGGDARRLTLDKSLS